MVRHFANGWRQHRVQRIASGSKYARFNFRIGLLKGFLLSLEQLLDVNGIFLDRVGQTQKVKWQ